VTFFGRPARFPTGLLTLAAEAGGWMSDTWWAPAQRSGLMSIDNHSWDHNHPEANVVCQKEQIKGSFEVIDTYTECRSEVEQAAEYISRKIAPAWPELFAYPWGQSSAYIREVYFPRFQTQRRPIAAFVANGGYVTKQSPRWNLPRFVCGSQQVGWETPAGLLRLLHATQ